MDTFRKLLLAFGALTVVTALSVGPALAAEPGGGDAATEQEGGTTGSSEDHGGESIVVTNEDGKMVLPLDPTDPRDAVGWGLIAFLTLAILLGLVNARKQLRGERDQASGEWRYR